MAGKVIVSESIPRERIEGLRFLYIVVDSDLNINYEFNNKGHIVLPIHKNEINPFKLYENLPKNLIKKCVSGKKDIVGVMQLWLYYTKETIYGRVKAIGILETFKGNRLKALLKLAKAMDDFCVYYGIKFIEAETSVIPKNVMERFGFHEEPESKWYFRFAQFISRQRHYVKNYD